MPRAAGEVVKAVYVLGGAGTGKSTFTARVVEMLQAQFGPLKDLHAKENKKNVVTLRGTSGQLTDVHVRDPKVLKDVKVGDQVVANITESVALRVTPAPAK